MAGLPLRSLGYALLGGISYAVASTVLAPPAPARGVPIGTPVHRFAAPGDYPEGLAWDGNYLWVNNFTNGTVYAVDPADGRIVDRFAGFDYPAQPEGLTWDGEVFWSSDWATGTITRLRPTSAGMEVVAEHEKPPGSGKPVGLTWDGTHLWLACFGPEVNTKSELFQIDPDDFQVVKKLQLPIWWVEDLAWDGERLWSVDWLFAIGFSIDPATGDTANTYRTPGPHPVGMAWDGRYLWLGDTQADSLWALDVSGARPTPVQSVTWSEMKRRYRN